MLNSVILYIPGSGGSFLRRALSLSDNSVMEFAEIKIAVEEKFTMFNNWNSTHWKSAEKMYEPAYRVGAQDFFEFENSDLYFIDAWHPVEFLEHDRSEICWPTGQWPRLIFLHISEQHRNFIERNQSSKQYSVDWDSEQNCFLKLRQQYQKEAIDIEFESLLSEKTFESTIRHLDQTLELKLNIPLAMKLWSKWYTQSTIVWRK